MDFSEALKAMRMGSRVARFEWYGRIFFWTILEEAKNEAIMETGFNGRRARAVKKIKPDDVLAKDWHVVT